jgi:hypothetical protein
VVRREATPSVWWRLRTAVWATCTAGCKTTSSDIAVASWCRRRRSKMHWNTGRVGVIPRESSGNPDYNRAVPTHPPHPRWPALFLPLWGYKSVSEGGLSHIRHARRSGIWRRDEAFFHRTLKVPE